MKKSILALTACLMLAGAAYAEDETTGLSFSLYGTSKVALGNLRDYEAANLGGGLSVEYALPLTLPIFEDIGIAARYEIEAPQYKWFRTYPGSENFTKWVAQNAKLGVFADLEIFNDLYFHPEVDLGVFWDKATYITNPNRKNYEDPIFASVTKAYPMIELSTGFRAYPSEFVGIEVAPTYTAVLGANDAGINFRGQYLGLRGGVSIKIPTLATMQSWGKDDGSDKKTTSSKNDKNSNKDSASASKDSDKNSTDKNATSDDDDSDSKGGFFSRLFGKKNKGDDADASKDSGSKDANSKDSDSASISKDSGSDADSADENADDTFKPTRKALSDEETAGMKKVYNSGISAAEAQEIRDEWRAKQAADGKTATSKDSNTKDSDKSTAKDDDAASTTKTTKTTKSTAKDSSSTPKTTEPEKSTTTTGMKKVYNTPSDSKDDDATAAKKEIKIRKNDNGTINIDIPNLMFVADSSELTDDPQNAETITKLYTILSDEDYENYTVDITGFINPDDPAGWTEAEKVLATDRAIAVKNILVYLGIGADRITAKAGDGYTDDPEYNRRVELLLSK